MEKSGFPVVHITAVHDVSKMIGVTRILRGMSVTNVLGDIRFSKEREKLLRRKFVLKALSILQTEIMDQAVFTLEGKASF